MLKLTTVSLVALFSLSGPYPQDDMASLRREIEALKAEQAAMKKDLEAIKSFLQALVQGGRPAEETLVNASISIAGEPARGSSTAKVTLVEVSDYHCPFCRRHMQETQPRIEQEYIRTGKVRYVFVDYPIEQLHPSAFKAHEAANCAGDQGKYWEMHAALFASPTRDVGQLVSQGESLGLDAAAFRACLTGNKYAAPVRESVARMQQLGIDSTPMFLIGLTPPDGQPMKILKVVKGAHPFQQFQTAIEGLL
ncbi:MAG TPA: DsbA family protein [Vicinamibacterales bacterium]|nr:DsbA family protein [Vicinamibacterales bacterium]